MRLGGALRNPRAAGDGAADDGVGFTLGLAAAGVPAAATFAVSAREAVAAGVGADSRGEDSRRSVAAE